MRTIRILKTGETDGRPWVRGVLDFEPNEQLAAMQLAQSTGARAPAAAFGMINGMPDEAVAKLVPGDQITATETNVTVGPDSYVAEDGTKIPSIRCRIRVAGKVTKAARVDASCSW